MQHSKHTLYHISLANALFWATRMLTCLVYQAPANQMLIVASSLLIAVCSRISREGTREDLTTFSGKVMTNRAFIVTGAGFSIMNLEKCKKKNAFKC